MLSIGNDLVHLTPIWKEKNIADLVIFKCPIRKVN